MVQRRPGPMGMGVQSCLLWFPPCGLWWWGIWEVGDGWPVLLLMVSCMYVVYVGMFVCI